MDVCYYLLGINTEIDPDTKVILHLAKLFQYFGGDTDVMLLTPNTIYDYVSHLQEVL